VLFLSSRRDGKTLGDMVRSEMRTGGRCDRIGRSDADHGNPTRCAGVVVVKALAASPGELSCILYNPNRFTDGRLQPLYSAQAA